MRNSPRKKAFTVIELLVVIAIIGALAILFLAVLGRSQPSRSSRRPACASNLSQIGKACMLYADVSTNQGLFPDASTSLRAMNLLFGSYILDERVFSCPSNPTLSALAGASGLANCKSDPTKANLT